MDPGEHRHCRAGSTGKPSGIAQVSEKAEADTDGLTPVFFLLGYAKHIHPVSQEGWSFSSWLGALT